MINEFRPRLGDEWRGIIEQIKQLGPERARLMIEEAKEYKFTPKEVPYQEVYSITKPGRGIILPCKHAPFHNVAQFESELKLIAAIKPDFFIIQGDFMDAFSVSRYNRGEWSMPGLTLQQEYDETNVLLDLLDDVLPEGCDKVYIEGNHEERIRHFKKPIDNAKLGDAIVDYHAALRLAERGYTSLAPYREARCLVGNTAVIHGLYWGVHAAATHLKNLNQDVVFCHTHRMQMYSDGRATATNIGWGGDVNAKVFRFKAWFEREKWVNSVSVIDLHEKGKTTVQSLRFDDGFLFEGKRF